jgi:superoxide reductase
LTSLLNEFIFEDIVREKEIHMSRRRDFLKGSVVLTGAAVLGGAVFAQGASKFPAGLVYTKDAPGRWAGKEGSHAPKVIMQGGSVKITTAHPMSEKHYIVKHTLLTPDGKVLGEKTFAPTDKTAESAYALPDGFKGAVWAASFCNIHDLWVTEFTV